MKQIFLPIVGVVAFLAVIGFVVQRVTQNPGEPLFGRAAPVVETKKKITAGNVDVLVEVVRTAKARQKGLSGKDSLEVGTGMLFVFDQKGFRPPFWMKDMRFSIDIIWISDGRVAQIHANVPVPESGTLDGELTLYIPNEPIDYVLEVNAGFAEMNEIAVGDPVNIAEAL